jgi:hypothetical protein
MSEVVHVKWYATIGRGDMFADAVAEMSPVSLRYGATRYSVQRSNDDRYNIVQMLWFANHDDWYRFWESAELKEFRARHAGHYQVLITYTPHEEVAAGGAAPTLVTPEPEDAVPETAPAVVA